jgi:hypothetical protein
VIGPAPPLSAEEREERQREQVRAYEESRLYHPPHSPHGAETEFSTDPAEVIDRFEQEPPP